MTPVETPGRYRSLFVILIILQAKNDTFQRYSLRFVFFKF